MASYFGPRCDFRLEAGSPPFAVFRNKEGHQVSSSFSSIATKKQYELRAWHDTLYYKQHQQDFPIPSDLLFETALEDSQLRNKEAKVCGRNSVLGFHHEDHSLVVHTAGKCSDQLVLRYADDLQPGLVDLPHSLAGQQPPPGTRKEFSSTSGFVLPLGGLQIDQVEAWGMSQFNTTSNLLARSAHSLYHVQTCNLQDSFPRPRPHFEQPLIPEFWSKRSIILDPVQKWDLSYGTVCSLSGSKSALASSYYLLNDRGGGGGAVTELHTLSPRTGPMRVLPRGCSIFPCGAAAEEAPVTVESLLHPHLCLLSFGASVFLKDLRTPSPSHILVRTPHHVTSLMSLQDTNSASATTCSTETSSYLLVGQAEDILLMDLRYSRSCLAQRPSPGGSHFMRKAALPVHSCSENQYMDDEREVVLTAGAQGRQLFSHQLNLSFQSPSPPAVWSSSSSRSQSHFLHSGGVFGGRVGSVAWETAGWPMIDRTREDSSRLLGIDLLPLSPSFGGSNISDCQDNKDREDSLEALHARCQGMVVQQSATGDVFAQFVQCFLEEEVDEHGEGDSYLHEREAQEVARRERKRRALERKAPIQVNLPLGTRCPPFPVKTNQTNNTAAIAAATAVQQNYLPGVAALRRQQDKAKRSTGLGVRGALLPQDEVEDNEQELGVEGTEAGEIGRRRNTYPLGERNMLPLQEDSEMKRMSVVMLDPAEMHLEPDHNMRTDPSIKVTKVPYKLLDKAQVSAMLLEEQDVLVRVLAMHFFTLYELWEWFVDHTGHDCDIELLRQSMLDVIQPFRHGNVRIKNAPADGGSSPGPLLLSSVELVLLPPPPSSLLAAADGLRVVQGEEEALLPPGAGGDGVKPPCLCHEAVERCLRRQERQVQRQSTQRLRHNQSQSQGLSLSQGLRQRHGRGPLSRVLSMSESCPSVHEEEEEDAEKEEEEEDIHSLSTCALPTCLMLHCLCFKVSGKDWPAPPAPLHPLRTAPSRVNPAYVARQQAKRARLEAVQEAQGGHGQVQVSDVTLEMMDKLNNDWGEMD